MFYIDEERNKIYLTIGDTAIFSCEIVDLEGNDRVPQEGDTLTLYIDDTDFEKVAANNAKYLFTINHDDTLELSPGLYDYRIVLTTSSNEQYTIFEDVFIELSGEEEESEPTPDNPQPEPEPQQEGVDDEP